MKIIINFLQALIIAFWLVIIPILSIQNITEVSLQFLFFESIKLPVGIMLSWSAAAGMIIGAILPVFWIKKSKKRKPNSYIREDVDYFDEEEEDPIFDWDE